MKAASTALVALIESGNFDAWVCYVFALRGGGTYLITNAPFAITDGVTTWPSAGPIEANNGGAAGSGPRAHWKVGTDTDTWQINIAPRLVDPVTGAALPDRLGALPFLAGVRAGLMRVADVMVKRAYFDRASFVYPAPVAGAVPVGFLTIARGFVGDAQISNGLAIITVMDYRQLLRTQMPRNLYQAGCIHTLYDSGCKLSASDFAKTGTVTSVASRTQFSSNAPAPGGSGDYTLGRVTFTSGANAGVTRTIQFWDGVHFIQTVSPFPFNIAVGDAVTLYPGCNKTLAHCTAFANVVNFGGDPFIPPPTVTSPTG